MNKMKIYLAEWNEINDLSRLFDISREGEPKKDDTRIAGQVILEFLKSLGHDVYMPFGIGKPPHSTQDKELDLFIGIGAGDPIGMEGYKKIGESKYMGVPTKFPIVWIGAQDATANPWAVRYRTLARWMNCHIEDITPIKHVSEYVPFKDRKGRDQAIVNAVKQVLFWKNECEEKPERLNSFAIKDEVKSDLKTNSEKIAIDELNNQIKMLLSKQDEFKDIFENNIQKEVKEEAYEVLIKLIKKDETEKVIGLIEEKFQSKFQNYNTELIMWSANLERINKGVRLNTLQSGEYNISRNNINLELVKLIDKVKNSH